jgi:hypothetical protein
VAKDNDFIWTLGIVGVALVLFLPLPGHRTDPAKSQTDDQSLQSAHELIASRRELGRLYHCANESHDRLIHENATVARPAALQKDRLLYSEEIDTYNAYSTCACCDPQSVRFGYPHALAVDGKYYIPRQERAAIKIAGRERR